MSFIYRSVRSVDSFKRVAYLLRIEPADRAPDFIPLRVKENKGRRVLEAIHRRKLHARSFLNIQADKMYPVAKFLFEPVNYGFQCCASQSVRRLEFQHDGGAAADQPGHHAGITHRQSLLRT